MRFLDRCFSTNRNQMCISLPQLRENLSICRYGTAAACGTILRAPQRTEGSAVVEEPAFQKIVETCRCCCDEGEAYSGDRATYPSRVGMVASGYDTSCSNTGDWIRRGPVQAAYFSYGQQGKVDSCAVLLDY